MQNKIYVNKIYLSDGKYYKLVKEGEPYCLWQPVKKFLWFYVNCGSPFLLDKEGFYKMSSTVRLGITARGFKNIDLVDKYSGIFYIRQSSADLKDVWLGIKAEALNPNYKGNSIGNNTYAILIDDETWKAIKRARRLCRK